MTYTTDASIYMAASEGNVERVRELLGRGYNHLEADSLGRLALHYALRLPVMYDEDYKLNKITIAEMLIERSPETQAYPDVAGETPVHLMAEADEFNDLLVHAINLAPSLLMKANNFGEYPIHVAIANRQMATSKTLLGVMHDAKLTDAHGNTLLHHAVMANNEAILHELIDKYHLDVNALNGDLQTALDIANSYHFNAIIEYLKIHGGRSTSSENIQFMS